MRMTKAQVDIAAEATMGVLAEYLAPLMKRARDRFADASAAYDEAEDGDSIDRLLSAGAVKGRAAGELRMINDVFGALGLDVPAAPSNAELPARDARWADFADRVEQQRQRNEAADGARQLALAQRSLVLREERAAARGGGRYCLNTDGEHAQHIDAHGSDCLKPAELPQCTCSHRLILHAERCALSAR